MPGNHLEGRLALTGEAGGGGFTEHVDSFRYTGSQDSPLKHLPEFDFELVQTGSHIVPVRRDSVPGSHPHWEYVLSPGRVWDEAGDNGYSRVALPFALRSEEHTSELQSLMRISYAVFCLKKKKKKKTTRIRQK